MRGIRKNPAFEKAGSYLRTTEHHPRHSRLRMHIEHIVKRMCARPAGMWNPVFCMSVLSFSIGGAASTGSPVSGCRCPAQSIVLCKDTIFFFERNFSGEKRAGRAKIVREPQSGASSAASGFRGPRPCVRPTKNPLARINGRGDGLHAGLAGRFRFRAFGAFPKDRRPTAQWLSIHSMPRRVAAPRRIMRQNECSSGRHIPATGLRVHL